MRTGPRDSAPPPAAEQEKKRNAIIAVLLHVNVHVYTHMKITWVFLVFAFALLSRKEFYKMVKKVEQTKKKRM